MQIIHAFPTSLLFGYLILSVVIYGLVNVNAASARRFLEDGDIKKAKQARDMVRVGVVLLVSLLAVGLGIIIAAVWVLTGGPGGGP